MDPVHDRESMDPVHESGPWTQSKVGPCLSSRVLAILCIVSIIIVSLCLIFMCCNQPDCWKIYCPLLRETVD